MRAAVAALDVEATYMNVLAYRYTSLTSVTLLDCTTIPGAARSYASGSISRSLSERGAWRGMDSREGPDT